MNFRPALIALFFAVSLSAQPAEWLALVEQAVEADDFADYKQAEALFSEACEQAQGFDSTEHQVKACVGLAHVYAVDSDFGKARKALQALIERLQAAPKPDAYSYAEALLELANCEMALARFDEGVASLRQLAEPMNGLPPPQAAQILAGMAEFYLPIDRQAVGGNLLRGAIEALGDGWNPEDLAYTEAAVRVAQVARWYDRPWESAKLMEPIVAAGQKRILLEGGPLARAEMLVYSTAAAELGYLANGTDAAEEAKKWRELAKEWQRMAEPDWPETPKQGLEGGPGIVTAPSLDRKKEPSYTLGAQRARVAGQVQLAVEVWPDGLAHNVRVVRPLPYGLTWEAIGTIRKWRFKPSTRNGEPVKVSATIEVNFQLVRR